METPVQFLGQQDSLEKGKSAHSSILAWRIPCSMVHGVARSWTRLSDFHSLHSLSDIWLANIFFSIGCLFILLIASFVVQKLLSLILCLMFILDFVAYTLGVIAEKSLPRSMLRSFCFLLGVSDFTFTFHFYTLEKEMATHSSVLAWRIPGMGSHRVGHD